jgi:hypothetical protein
MRLRKFLRKIHRWIGIIASIWLLLLASTGLLLQHKDDWNLAHKYTQSALLLSLYDIGQQFTSYGDQQNNLAQLDYQIYIDGTAKIKLEEPIIGAVYQQPNWIIATASQINWIDTHGQIIQSMDEFDGITLPIEKLGHNQTNLIIQNQSESIELKTLQPTMLTTTWSQAIDSESLKIQLIETSTQNYLSYEQLIFDLHAGITSPSLFNDIAALALIFLSISGIIIFFKKSFRNQKNF